MAVTARPAGIYEGTRIPSPIPTVLEVDPSEHDLDDVLTVNFGPNHPSTHGVLRLVVDLDGEHVAGLRAVVGYLHTGFEKTMEEKTWWKGMTYPERIDYVAYVNNGLVWVLAVEKLLGLEVPRKATWMRMCLAEINRLHSHLIWLGTSALEIGAISMLWYAFRERELTVELSELVGGTRMHTRYFQAGGLAEDLPPGFVPVAREFCKRMSKGIDDYDRLLTRNAIWLQRTKGVGLLSADDAIALGQSGPVLRASGVDWDLRRDDPYLAYGQLDFEVVTDGHEDVLGRTLVRIGELMQAYRIIRQVAATMPDGPLTVKAPRKVKAGEAIVRYEAPRGENLHYVQANGTDKPERVKVRAPTLANTAAVGLMMERNYLADVPIIIAAIDPCFSCTDRAISVGEGGGDRRVLSWRELRQAGIDFYRREAGVDFGALNQELAARLAAR